ncbi:MAG: glycosyltransferase [Planctomycetes bacterium]|nr:glycosyltransferase [Planctomycetota bacterium]
MKISVILPTYCERGNIVELLAAIEAVLGADRAESEVVVVDDNSPDGTADVVREYAKTSVMRVQCHVRTTDRGLASAIKFGVRHAGGDLLIVMDTDFNHDPAMIPQMIRCLEYYDLVIGSRFVMGGGMEDSKRYYYSLFYNMFVRAMLRLQVQDNLSGYFAIRRERLMTLNLDSIFHGYGEYFIRLLYDASRLKYRVLELPIFYILRRHGQSKSRFLAMLGSYTRCVFSVMLFGNK